MNDNLGLLAARLAFGLGIAAHGAQKAFGWFDGPGLDGAAKFMDTLGLKPGAKYASAAAYNEVGAGVLIALGLGGPLGPAALVSTMVVAAETVHKKNGFFAGKGGIELNVLYSAGAVALASAGYGALSLDRALRLEGALRKPPITWLALAAGVASAYAILGQRDLSPPDGSLATPTIKGRERNGAATGSAPEPAST